MWKLGVAASLVALAGAAMAGETTFYKDKIGKWEILGIDGERGWGCHIGTKWGNDWKTGGGASVSYPNEASARYEIVVWDMRWKPRLGIDPVALTVFFNTENRKFKEPAEVNSVGVILRDADDELVKKLLSGKKFMITTKDSRDMRTGEFTINGSDDILMSFNRCIEAYAFSKGGE